MPTPPSVRISHAATPAEVAAARELLGEYFAWLQVGDPALRAAELLSLPGEYASPGGRLLLAWPSGERATGRQADKSGAAGEAEALGEAAQPGEPVGIVALRRLEDGICELKRLYVRRELRGTGLGRALTLAAIEEARAIGYSRVRLDTLPRMREALSLYRGMGFREIPRYRASDISCLVFLELDLGLPGERLGQDQTAPGSSSPNPPLSVDPP